MEDFALMLCFFQRKEMSCLKVCQNYQDTWLLLGNEEKLQQMGVFRLIFIKKLRILFIFLLFSGFVNTHKKSYFQWKNNARSQQSNFYHTSIILVSLHKFNVLLYLKIYYKYDTDIRIEYQYINYALFSASKIELFIGESKEQSLRDCSFTRLG